MIGPWLILLLCAGPLCAQSVFSSGSFASLVVPAAPSSGPPADGYEANVFAYYKFEDVSDGAIDSAHGRNLAQYGASDNCGVSYGQTGILGHCLEMGSTCGFGSGVAFRSGTFFGGSGADFNLEDTGQSFTLRFWIKTQAASFNNTFINLENFVKVSYGSVGAFGDQKIDFYLVGNILSYDIVSGQSVADGAWHRVVCTWNASTLEAGVQIDNNAPVTQITEAMTDPGPWDLNDLGGPTDYLPNPPDPSFLFDDFAIWKDYLLTSGDLLFDWNSGFGRTYPLP